MNRITIARGRRADLSRPSRLFGGGNTCLFEGERVIVQKLASGKVAEVRLTRLVDVGARPPGFLHDSEIWYDGRTGMYSVRIGDDTWLADLPESVVAPSRKLLRSVDGPARLSAQVVCVGPSSAGWGPPRPLLSR